MDQPLAHIACCIDDSPESASALAEALRLRATCPGRLTLVHAAPEPLLYAEPLLMDPRDLRAASERWLEARVAATPGAEGRLLTGLAQTAITEWAEQERPDLLVAAPRRRALARLVLGSVSNHLAHHSPVPLLLVRPCEAEVAPPAGGPYAHIVCCVEPSAASDEALALAVRLRGDGPGRLTALTVARFTPESDVYPSLPAFLDADRVSEAAGEWLADRAAREDRVSAVVLSGYPPAAATAWARDNGADLMVAAAHRGLVERLRLGSFAAFLAHQAPCSVLLTRPRSPGPADA